MITNSLQKHLSVGVYVSALCARLGMSFIEKQTGWCELTNIECINENKREEEYFGDLLNVRIINKEQRPCLGKCMCA